MASRIVDIASRDYAVMHSCSAAVSHAQCLSRWHHNCTCSTTPADTAASPLSSKPEDRASFQTSFHGTISLSICRTWFLNHSSRLPALSHAL